MVVINGTLNVKVGDDITLTCIPNHMPDDIKFTWYFIPTDKDAFNGVSGNQSLSATSGNESLGDMSKYETNISIILSSDQTYRKTKASKEDAGKYTCRGESNMGTAQDSVYLQTTSNPLEIVQDDLLEILPIIGISVVVVIVLVVITYLYVRRKLNRVKPSNNMDDGKWKSVFSTSPYALYFLLHLINTWNVHSQNCPFIIGYPANGEW